MSATLELIRTAILEAPPCPDRPAQFGACPSCLAHAVDEALRNGAPTQIPGQLDLCEHMWPGELGTEADCLRCGISYSEWIR